MIRTCTCGRILKPVELFRHTGRLRCPDCGSRSHCWDRLVSLWPRVRRRKPQELRYTSDHPGPRVFAADYGFAPEASTLFALPSHVADLRLSARKNRWRFEQL